MIAEEDLGKNSRYLSKRDAEKTQGEHLCTLIKELEIEKM